MMNNEDRWWNNGGDICIQNDPDSLEGMTNSRATGLSKGKSARCCSNWLIQRKVRKVLLQLAYSKESAQGAAPTRKE